MGNTLKSLLKGRKDLLLPNKKLILVEKCKPDLDKGKMFKWSSKYVSVGGTCTIFHDSTVNQISTQLINNLS